MVIHPIALQSTPTALQDSKGHETTPFLPCVWLWDVLFNNKFILFSFLIGNCHKRNLAHLPSCVGSRKLQKGKLCGTFRLRQEEQCRRKQVQSKLERNLLETLYQSIVTVLYQMWLSTSAVWKNGKGRIRKAVSPFTASPTLKNSFKSASLPSISRNKGILRIVMLIASKSFSLECFFYSASDRAMTLQTSVHNWKLVFAWPL